MHVTRTRRLTSLAALMTMALAACSTSPVFVGKRQIVITKPAALASSGIPVRIAWRTTGTPPRGAVAFAVFVDQAPVHPGQNLRAIVERADIATAGSCHPPSCPDAAFLQTLQVYLVRGHAVSIPFVAELRIAHRDAASAFHQATIVFVSKRGDRVGEDAATVQFRTEIAVVQ
jgi:hypothetical protein